MNVTYKKAEKKLNSGDKQINHVPFAIENTRMLANKNDILIRNQTLTKVKEEKLFKTFLAILIIKQCTCRGDKGYCKSEEKTIVQSIYYVTVLNIEKKLPLDQHYSKFKQTFFFLFVVTQFKQLLTTNLKRSNLVHCHSAKAYLCTGEKNSLKGLKAEMSLTEASVTIGSRDYALHLTNLTFDDLKEQVVKASEEDERGKVLTKITDLNGHDIETDKQLQNTSPLHFYAYFQSNDQEKKETNSAEIQIETLDIGKHWNKNWRHSNAIAAKCVMKMLNNNEQGLIIVANNTNLWQMAISKASIATNDGTFSFRVLINNEKLETKVFGEYCLYVIKSKIILFNEITIDGNVYAVNCEIQCKGNNVNITTQLFVTSHVIIPQSLTKSISPIQWDTKIHYDIFVPIQDLADASEQYVDKRNYSESINCLQQALHRSIKAFEAEEYDKAVEYDEKALQILSKALGLHIWNIYLRKRDYTKSIECYEHSLKIRKEILGISSRNIGDSCWNLAMALEQNGEKNKACQYFEESWKTYTVLYGEWNIETLRARKVSEKQ
ncbi:hypothetical protein RFI_19948 [Reticulomyxa filosa]|uniref:Uncharacterized protein n=1 Tax=Reticulomyxa filosa TaxID=46433 RepID=X6MUA8_RETFI|nr:hypothetical protein RFI_19948 [Reticulomyxa filosa]|eukprot:ETO17374.1 hypothetical protein RFI_19948 [Reticulomyxa filosa]